MAKKKLKNIKLPKDASTAWKLEQLSFGQESAFNSAEAEKSRDWQEYMSNTSHSREVRDLVNSGLNPVLSANGGAQSYTSASASASSDNTANAYANIYSSNLNAQLQREQMRNQRAIAEVQASAERYVADRNYQAQIDKPQSNLLSLVDKYLFTKKINLGDTAKNFIVSGLEWIQGFRKESPYYKGSKITQADKNKMKGMTTEQKIAYLRKKYLKH